MTTVSAVIIAKNEATHLAQCLQTLLWANEIIVLDSGSSDATCEIAARFNARVALHTNWQGFGVQRQRAQALARCTWILMIDADERVTPELQRSILQTIKGKPCIGRVSRLTWCFGGFIRHAGWYPDAIDRLYPNDAAHYNAALVHEKLLNPNNLPIIRLKGDLLHFTYDSMHHYLVKSANYADLWARDRQEKGKSSRLSAALMHGMACFVRMYLFKAGFLDGRRGLLVALLSAHSTFVKYADLWVRDQTHRHEIDVPPNS